MAGYSIASLAELGARAGGFLTGAIEGAVVSLRPSTFKVFAKVMALLGFEQEQRRAWLYDQIFASRAAKAALVRHGYELGLGGPAPAAAASGTILVPAVFGLAVPGALQFQASNGLTYTSLTAETAEGATVALPVLADAPGAAGNLAAGFPLTLVPDQDVPAGLGGTALVAAGGLAGGADEEAIEDYRARVLDRKRQPPQGGSTHDYETWANEALGPGILRKAYVGSFQNDTRSVWLCLTVTDQPDGIPTDGQVALVQAYCDDPIRRPVTARVFATEPIPLPIDVEIADLTPDTLDVRESVKAEIAATFLDRAEVGTGGNVVVVFSRSWIGEAVAHAVGEDAHTLVQPAASVVVSPGYLPVLGQITFT